MEVTSISGKCFRFCVNIYFAIDGFRVRNCERRWSRLIGLFVSPILSGCVSQKHTSLVFPHLARLTLHFLLQRAQLRCVCIIGNCVSVLRIIRPSRNNKKEFTNGERGKSTFYPTESWTGRRWKTSFLPFTWRALSVPTARTHSNSFYIEKFEPRKELNTRSFLNFTSYWMKVKEFHWAPVISLVPSIYQKSWKFFVTKYPQCYQDNNEQ